MTDITLRQIADEIENSGGIYLMASANSVSRQLGIRKTAIVIAALRAAQQPRTEYNGTCAYPDEN